MALSREVEIERLKNKVLEMDIQELERFVEWGVGLRDVRRFDEARRKRKAEPAPAEPESNTGESTK